MLKYIATARSERTANKKTMRAIMQIRPTINFLDLIDLHAKRNVFICKSSVLTTN